VLDVACGGAATVGLDASAADPDARALTDDVRDFSRRTPHALVVRLASAPRRALALAAAVLDGCDAARGRAVVDPRAGTIVIAVLDEDGGGGRPDSAAAQAAQLLAEISTRAAEHRAHVTVERWPLELADHVTVWAPVPATLPLMRRMKAAFDPRGTLAPGRFVGRI
jgi:FAD/FMN-containing dehydrogenase